MALFKIPAEPQSVARVRFKQGMPAEEHARLAYILWTIMNTPRGQIELQGDRIIFYLKIDPEDYIFPELERVEEIWISSRRMEDGEFRTSAEPPLYL